MVIYNGWITHSVRHTAHPAARVSQAHDTHVTTFLYEVLLHTHHLTRNQPSSISLISSCFRGLLVSVTSTSKIRASLQLKSLM